MMYIMYYIDNDVLYAKKINDLSEVEGYNIYCVKDMTGTVIIDYRRLGELL